MSNTYTQRQWDREVGWGKVPAEYAMSSEDWVAERILLNELTRMEVLQDGQYTDQDIIVREWIQSRIKDLTKYRE